MKNLVVILFCSFIWIASCTEESSSKKSDDAHTTHNSGNGELQLSDLQIQLGNILVDSLAEKIMDDELFITGIVTVDQTKATTIATRVMGRIEKLYFKNPGENVNKGDVLYEIFSEDLNIAIKELQLTAEKNAILKNDQIDLRTILESVRTRLRLYGLSENQIIDLERNQNFSNNVKILSPASGVITSVDIREGEYLMEGASVLQLTDLSTLWVEAQVYSDYMNVIKSGMNVNVSIPGEPKSEFEGQITFVNPELNPASKINLARIQIPNAKQKIKPGAQAFINVLTDKVKSLALPTDAIILDGKGATVWVQSGKNTFKPKMVKTGIEANGFTQIIGGLEKGEKVVVSGAYLLNSEYVFRNGTNPMESHDMNNM